MDRASLLADTDQCVAWLRARLTPPEPPLEPAARTARPAAVLVPLHAGPGGEPHLLFTVRATTLTRHSGEIAFPGGKRDPDDASLAATALREAREEIGLPEDRVALLGALPPVFTVVSNYVIWPQVGLARGTVGELAPAVNAAEVAAIFVASLAQLADPAIAHTEEWRRDGRARLVYFYQFGAYRIWGATARILAHLLALLPAA